MAVDQSILGIISSAGEGVSVEIMLNDVVLWSKSFDRKAGVNLPVQHVLVPGTNVLKAQLGACLPGQPKPRRQGVLESLPDDFSFTLALERYTLIDTEDGGKAQAYEQILEVPFTLPTSFPVLLPLVCEATFEGPPGLLRPPWLDAPVASAGEIAELARPLLEALHAALVARDADRFQALIASRITETAASYPLAGSLEEQREEADFTMSAVVSEKDFAMKQFDAHALIVRPMAGGRLFALNGPDDRPFLQAREVNGEPKDFKVHVVRTANGLRVVA